MFWFKSCPRCSGDLYDDKDSYGISVVCAQCGFHRDVTERDLTVAQLAGRWSIGQAPLSLPEEVAAVPGRVSRRHSHDRAG